MINSIGPKRVVIFGAGWLGTTMRDFFVDKADFVYLSEKDIANPDEVGRILRMNTPDLVINAAGKTGRPNTDWCEMSEENQFLTWRSNVLGPAILREQCQKRGIFLMHLSSGCIYSGLRPYYQERRRYNVGGFLENDPPNPNSVYCWSKLMAEQVLNGYLKLLVVRLHMPFWGKLGDGDKQLNPRDLLAKLLSYSEVVADQKNSITYVPDMLSAVWQLLKRGISGRFHIVNPGPITNVEILELYRQIVDTSHRYTALTLREFMQKKKDVTARLGCVLSTAKLEAAGIYLPDALTRLKECFTDMADYKRNQECLKECMLGDVQAVS